MIKTFYHNLLIHAVCRYYDSLAIACHKTRIYCVYRFLSPKLGIDRISVKNQWAMVYYTYTILATCPDFTRLLFLFLQKRSTYLRIHAEISRLNININILQLYLNSKGPNKYYFSYKFKKKSKRNSSWPMSKINMSTPDLF